MSHEESNYGWLIALLVGVAIGLALAYLSCNGLYLPRVAALCGGF